MGGQITRILRAFVILLPLEGCGLPAATVRELTVPATLSATRLCEGGIEAAHFTEHSRASTSGALECSDSQATIVLFNSFNLRVRTITVTDTGAVRDEKSYLSPSQEEAEKLVLALQEALACSAPSTGDYRVELSQVTRRIDPSLQ